MASNCTVQQDYWICIVLHIISAAVLLEEKKAPKIDILRSIPIWELNASFL